MPLFAYGGELGGTALTSGASVDWRFGAGQCRSDTRYRLVALRRARSNHSGGFLAGCLAGHILKRSDGPACLPVFRRPTGNCFQVMLGLLGQFALPRQPILIPRGAGIVGGRRKSKIAAGKRL